ncbi:MAG: hypothetical protein ACRDMV_17955 [Streptosporangiales bacterium]
MTATPLTPTARYIPPGVRQYYFVTTIEDKTAPTRPELDAGTDLSIEIAAVDGFTTSSDSVDAPDLGSRFTSKVPGMITADDSSINIYNSTESDGAGDARTLMPRDTKGFIVQFPEGDDGGDGPNLMNVFPVTVSSASVQSGMEDPGQTQFMFTITSEPAANVEVPAAA